MDAILIQMNSVYILTLNFLWLQVFLMVLPSAPKSQQIYDLFTSDFLIYMLYAFVIVPFPVRAIFIDFMTFIILDE